MPRSTFIPSEQVARFARWQFAGVDADGVPQGGIEDPDSLREAYAQGHAEGREAGRAEAMAEARQQMDAYLAAQGAETARQLAALLAAAEAGLAEAQQDIARGTLDIACALARQVLRQELATRPDALQPVVREALGMLLVDGKSAAVRLSPADFDRLDAPLRAEFTGQAVHVIADAAVAPGDCLIESAGAVVDGSVAARWSRAVAALGLSVPWQAEAGDAA